MSWPLVKLGDVATVINGRAYNKDELLPAGKYPVLRVGNFFSNRDWYYSDLELDAKNYCDTGDLLYAWSASFGPKIWDEGKVIYHYHIWKLVLNEDKVDKKYLFYFLQRDVGKIKQEHGAGSTMIHITKGAMEERLISLPPLEEQKRIAAILDKADAIRRKRQQAIKLADDFLRSVFLEMFGDPVTNPKGIDVVPMTECFHITTGKLNSNAANDGGKYPFFTCAKEVFYIDDYVFDQEALLLAGNNASADYDVKHYVGKFNAYQRTYVLTLKDGASSYEFYKFALEYQLQNLKRSSKGSNTKYITMEIMARTFLPSVDKKLQDQFVGVYRRVGKIMSSNMQSLKKLEAGFESLSQKAFSGEL